MMSVESMIESFVPVYENRNNKKRQIAEEHDHQEMLVAISGPELAHCNSLVKASMANYWKDFKHKDAWHFTRRSEDIKFHFNSKSVDKFTKQSRDLPSLV